jgi:hypothetical protein
MKAYESDVVSDSEEEPMKGIWIIDMEPNAIVATTKIHLDEPDEKKEGKCLFHSYMWVKGAPLYFIVDRDIHKNLI